MGYIIAIVGLVICFIVACIFTIKKWIKEKKEYEIECEEMVEHLKYLHREHK